MTAVVLTYNEEENIDFCMRSICGICKSIFILDSGSTDATLEICRNYTNQIYYHEFKNSADQWQWALDHLPIQDEWIMLLDADHVLSGPLQSEIVNQLAEGEQEISAYYCRHRYIYRGKKMHGFKSRGLLLFRRGCVRLDSGERHDYKFIIQGQVAELRGFRYEENRKENDQAYWLQKHRIFADRIARDELLRLYGMKQWQNQGWLFGHHDERIVWLKQRWLRMPLFVRPFLYFFYRYIFRGGFRDGWIGLQYHFLQAFWFRVQIDIKRMKLKHDLGIGRSNLKDLNS